MAQPQRPNRPSDPPRTSRTPATAVSAGGRGRTADTPAQVPARGWKDITKRTLQQIKEDNLSIVAAGVAFFGFLAIVPAMAAVIAIYGLVADPATISSHLDALQRIVPSEAMPLLEEQLARITETTTAGWSAAIGLVLTLFGALKGTKALMEGLNIAYDEQERRGFVKLHLVALTLTLGAIVGVAAMVGLIAILPAVLGFMHISSTAETVLSWLRWPVLAALFMFGLAALYRYGPCRDKPQWKWVSPGAAVASVIWLIASAAFSLYATSFGNFDKTYGSLGAVVAFLLWMYLSAFVILLGAEFNCEQERQTKKDTTEGPPEPMGTRGAHAADSLGHNP
jgi:membrane protein